MIIHGEQIRLTPKEHRRLIKLTGSDSRYIKTPKKLEQFVHAHLVNYPGRSPEERLLRKMLESFLPEVNSSTTT